MKIFISWSGRKSQDFGEAIRKWLPTVLQTAKPYFTPDDIEKGTRWSSNIAAELDDSSAGIFCVTKENMDSPWLLFEAGAISKKVDTSLVCPILIDIDNSDITGPLTQFQTTLFNKSDFRKLILALNQANTGNIIDEHVLSTTFEKFWPDLEKEVQRINSSPNSDEGTTPEHRSDRDLLVEVLHLSRTLANQKSGCSESTEELHVLISNFMQCYVNVFERDWDFTQECLQYNQWHISETGTFNHPGVGDEYCNWGNRGALLHSYRELVSHMRNIGIYIQY